MLTKGSTKHLNSFFFAGTEKYELFRRNWNTV